jgi:hypothetical protein
MPAKNVKKLVQKEVKAAERKVHAKPKRKFKRNLKQVDRKRVVISKGAGPAMAAVRAITSGLSEERREAGELARRMCCPNVFDSFAVQDGFNSMPVGVSSPYMVIPNPATATDGAAADALGVPNNEQWAFAYRDPHRTLQLYDPVARTFEYVAINDAGSSTISIGANFGLSIDAWNYSSGVGANSDVYGAKLYTGIVSQGDGAGARWTIGQKNMYLRVTGVPVSTSCTLDVQILMGDEVFTGTITATSTAGGILTLNFSAWVPRIVGTVLPSFFHFRWSTLNQSINLGSIFVGGTAIPVMRQYSLSKFENVSNIVQRLRFNALNLMFSNTSAVLNRQGSIAGWQVPSNIDPFGLVARGYDQFTVSDPTVMRIDADKGAHIFWKSTDLDDWKLEEVGDSQDGSSGGGNYIIDGDSDFLALCMQLNAAAGRSGYWSVFTAVEYRHNSVWFPVVRPNHTRKVFEDALEIVGRIPFLHCNPFHINDIFKWIGQHKQQIQNTITMAGGFGGMQGSYGAAQANKFLDIWFR